MKLRGKIDHSKNEFEDIFADCASEDKSMLEALMKVVNGLTNDSEYAKLDNDFMEGRRIGFAFGMVATLILNEGLEHADEYSSSSRTVKSLIKIANNETELLLFAKAAADMVNGVKISNSDPESCNSKTKVKSVKINVDTGKAESVDLSELPDEVKEALKKELGS